MRKTFVILLTFIITTITTLSFAQNRVLSLDGDGDYVRLPANIFNDLTEATVEGWVRWESFGDVSRFFDFGKARQAMVIADMAGISGLTFFIYDEKGQKREIEVAGVLRSGEWFHIAGVSGKAGMKLYLNGVLVGENEYTGSFSAIKNGDNNYFGKSHFRQSIWGYGTDTDFHGQMDEIRVWQVARTRAQIQQTMYQTLTGNEPELIGLWSFDNGDASDSSPNGYNGVLVDNAHGVAAELPTPGELSIPTKLSGTVTDAAGKPISNAAVRLEKDGEEIAETKTDVSGHYLIFALLRKAGLYDLSAKHDELGAWHLGFRMRAGEERHLDLVLEEAISIEGILLMLDNATPHVSVPVQAIRDGEVIDGMLSDENGEYRFINLKPGKYRVRCQVLGGYAHYTNANYVSPFTVYDSPDRKDAGEVLSVKQDRTLRNIDFRFLPFKKGAWKAHTFLDGLAGNGVKAIHCHSDKLMWFGTNGGLSRYDGQEFKNYTTKDGLVGDWINALYTAPDGVMWLATSKGVSRYDGKSFVNFTTADGLAFEYVNDVDGSADGAIWFATGQWGVSGGVSRYDGEQFQNFTTNEGLAVDNTRGVHCDPDGVVWLATWGGGVSRYDGEEFRHFTVKEKLAGSQLHSLYREANGGIWAGTHNHGVSWYNGEEFVTYTTKEGLANNTVDTIHRDPDGVMWFGTRGGLSRYDGKSFVNFTTADGLPSNHVLSIYREPNGVLWIGTIGGVCRYDESAPENLTTKDGLAHDNVWSICAEPGGGLWFATGDKGVSRYDGKEFVTFTTADGLVDNDINDIHCDRDGILWFGAFISAGVSRYDGQEFVTVKVRNIMSIDSAPDGAIWFSSSGGVFRYDGKDIVNFRSNDGLPGLYTTTIHCGPDSSIWAGTVGGAARYDGQKFIPFTTADGLPDNWINYIYSAERQPEHSGMLWFGTNAGVSRYDGQKFTNFSVDDGLGGNLVNSIYRDTDGLMWFGTHSGGVSLYDGTAWTALDRRDGLAGNTVRAIHQDEKGFIWFATEGGVTRYRRDTTPGLVRIVSVKTDKEYTHSPLFQRGVRGNFQAIPPITTGSRVTIKYSAIDFVTVPEKRQYRYRIREIDSDWRKPTKEDMFDETFNKPGTYTFEVQAIDRDLNYSEPATLTFQVKRPWWVFVLFGTIGVSVPLIALGFLFGKRLQTQRAIAQQFNPYIAGRVVGSDLFYGRSDLITDIERTLANNCFLLYGERRIGKTSLQHQLRERLQNADDPTYRFIPAYIDLQGVAENDFFRTIAVGVVEACRPSFREELSLRLEEDRDRYTYRELNRDLRTIINHLKENEPKTIKLVLLMDEVDTLNTYSLRANLNLRGLFMGPLKENLVLVMSGLYLKMDWSNEGAGSPPFNFLSREIQIQPLNDEDARNLITEPVKGFYSYEPMAVDLIIELSELKPFTIQGFCLRAVNRILADGRTKITVADIKGIKESVLAEVQSIRGEQAGTSLPASLNEALSRIADLEAELANVRENAA